MDKCHAGYWDHISLRDHDYMQIIFHNIGSYKIKLDVMIDYLGIIFHNDIMISNPQMGGSHRLDQVGVSDAGLQAITGYGC